MSGNSGMDRKWLDFYRRIERSAGKGISHQISQHREDND